MHTIISEKILEQLLTQYYRWLRDKQYEESLKTLKDWVSEEAKYQVQAAKISNGISGVCGVTMCKRRYERNP